MSELYTVFIYPLELLFEVVFTIANRIIGHPGWSIIVLSLAVNFLVLPLYNRADAVQKEERELEDSLKSGIARIKGAFKGDERMMMLQAYYKENNYSPLYVLKGSVSLLLQIPFFMAAYNFLSHLPILRGASFGIIDDLGSPDHMLVLAGISINVLPIIMTAVNFISGYIYTKGMPLKSKVQLYGMALLFLVLLYNSPSGLAFYWTLNNVFSLLKNALYKLKRPGFVFSVFCACIGLFAAIYLNTAYYTPYASRRMRLTVLSLALALPLAFILLKTKTSFRDKKLIKLPEYSKHDRNVFIVSGLFMSLLTGLMIPSAVVKISPDEFMDLMNLKNPIIYIIHALLIAVGYFLVWGGVFFSLGSDKVKAVMSRLWLVMCPASLVSYLFFGTKLGDISVNFVYFMPFEFTASQKLINLCLILLAAAAFLFLNKKMPKITSELVMTIAVVCLVMSVINMVPINKAYRANVAKAQNEIPRFTLSTEGQNVMVIMLDRAPGYFVPIIFDECPQLYDEFDGFTYYPNTLSFGHKTKFAAPALFGGYEYTPEAFNEASDRTLVDMQNEALSVMPILFRDEGFEVTIMDPPFAGYQNPGDLTVFSGPEYEGIEAYHTKYVLIDDYYKFEEYQEQIWFRNFFCYSIFKISPLYIQATVYNEGLYNQPQDPANYEVGFTIPQAGFSGSSSGGVDRDCMASYEALCKLDEVTVISNEPINTFMYIDNDTAHDTMLFQAPDYVPYQYVDNIQYDIDHAYRFETPVNGYYLDMSNYTSMRHYSSNAATYLRLGEYFDFLREQGVWDNTRIIIVADHGIPRTDANMFGGQLDMNGTSVDSYNPILMVKDFGATGFTTDTTFMTNADVPYLATQGVIDNPVNPFTGNAFMFNTDYAMPMHILDSGDWSIAGPDSFRFAEDDWYAFDGTEVFDIDSWRYDGVR